MRVPVACRVWAAHYAMQADRRNGGLGGVAAGEIADEDTAAAAANVAAVACRTAMPEATAARILSRTGMLSEVFPDGVESATGNAWEALDGELPASIAAAKDDDAEEEAEGGLREAPAEEDAVLLGLLDVPELRGAVEDVLNRIPLLHADVLAYRYGLRGEVPLARKDIAARLGFKSVSLVPYHHGKAMKSFSNMLSYMHKLEEAP